MGVTTGPAVERVHLLAKLMDPLMVEATGGLEVVASSVRLTFSGLKTRYDLPRMLQGIDQVDAGVEELWKLMPELGDAARGSGPLTAQAFGALEDSLRGVEQVLDALESNVTALAGANAGKLRVDVPHLAWDNPLRNSGSLALGTGTRASFGVPRDLLRTPTARAIQTVVNRQAEEARRLLRSLPTTAGVLDGGASSSRVAYRAEAILEAAREVS